MTSDSPNPNGTPNARFSAHSATDSSFRLVLTAETLDPVLPAALDRWLLKHAPHARYTVAELANPGRSGGGPVQAVAVEGLDRNQTQLLRTAMEGFGEWSLAEVPEQLHFTSH